MKKLSAQQEEIARNREALAKLLPGLGEAVGQYALMHNGEVECILKDFHDAVIMGNKLYGNKPFSVQPIVHEAVNLGSYSYKHPV